MGNSLLGRQENEAWGASLRRGSIKETAILTEQKRGQFWENIRRRHSSQGKGCCCWLLDASTYRISLAFSYNGCRFSRIADEACQELLYCASWEDNSWLNLPILSEYILLLHKKVWQYIYVFVIRLINDSHFKSSLVIELRNCKLIPEFQLLTINFTLVICTLRTKVLFRI